MWRLKAKAISIAMSFFWAVQAFAAEPKTEKIEVTLDIPANPFLDQVCVIANYLTIGAIICSIVFGGIWLMQKKDSSDDENENDDDEDEDDDDEEVRAPVGSMAKIADETPEETKVDDAKVEEPPVVETKVEEPKVEEPKAEEPKAEEPEAEEPEAEEPPKEVAETEETTAEELKPAEKAPAASKSKKAENDGTAKKPRKSKKKE